MRRALAGLDPRWQASAQGKGQPAAVPGSSDVQSPVPLPGPPDVASLGPEQVMLTFNRLRQLERNVPPDDEGPREVPGVSSGWTEGQVPQDAATGWTPSSHVRSTMDHSVANALHAASPKGPPVDRGEDGRWVPPPPPRPARLAARAATPTGGVPNPPLPTLAEARQMITGRRGPGETSDAGSSGDARMPDGLPLTTLGQPQGSSSGGAGVGVPSSHNFT